ncbi:MAG TPA: hypothetical protein PKY59_13790 [Pyrinomonadaceae bacterium]|nr:hypothetical protein [Pyrinomonadaceae bacterium]
MAREELMNPPNGFFKLNEPAIGKGQAAREPSAKLCASVSSNQHLLEYAVM